MNQIKYELGLIFNIQKDKAASDAGDQALDDTDFSIQTLMADRFNQNVVDTLRHSIDIIMSTASKVEEVLSDDGEPNDVGLRVDLADYHRLFIGLAQNLSLLVDSLSGRSLICHPHSELHNLIFTNTGSDQSFMENVHELISNANDLLSIQQAKATLPIDLKLLFNVRRFIYDFVQGAFDSFMKVPVEASKKRESLTQTMKNEQMFFNKLACGKCDFTLQVIDQPKNSAMAACFLYKLKILKTRQRQQIFFESSAADNTPKFYS